MAVDGFGENTTATSNNADVSASVPRVQERQGALHQGDAVGRIADTRAVGVGGPGYRPITREPQTQKGDPEDRPSAKAAALAAPLAPPMPLRDSHSREVVGRK
jgi:hypothetical protein